MSKVHSMPVGMSLEWILSDTNVLYHNLHRFTVFVLLFL